MLGKNLEKSLSQLLITLWVTLTHDHEAAAGRLASSKLNGQHSLPRSEKFIAYDPPTIYPPERDYLVLAIGSSQILRCVGSRPVQWSLPAGRTASDRQRLRLSSNSNQRSAKEASYIALLELRNLNYKDTGAYKCSYNDSNETRGDFSTSIHLYVYDENHLLTNEDFDYHQFVQYERAIVPCSTTHPGVKVELVHDGTKTVQPDGDYVKFDPKIGFSIFPVLLESAGLYMCTGKYKGNENTYVTNLRVLPKTRYVPPPHIRKISDFHTGVGTELRLSCTVTIDWPVKVNLSWSFPEQARDRVHLPASSNKNVTFGGRPLKVVEQQLTVKSVQKEDQDNYECMVNDHSGNARSKKEFVRVFDVEESFIKFWHDGPDTVDIRLTDTATQVGKGGRGAPSDVVWSVYIDSFPFPPKISWIDPDGVLVITGDPEYPERSVETRLESGPRQYLTRLKLKEEGIRLQSSGTYSLIADNGVRKSDKNFTLTAKLDEPIIEVTISPQPSYRSGSVQLFRYGESRTLRCRSRSNPRPTLDWSFRSCSTYLNCSKTLVPFGRLTYIEENTKNIGKFEAESVVRVKATESGQFTCLSLSGSTVAQKRLELFITDLKQPLEISGPSDVLDGDDLTLKCSTSKYIYSEDDIQWYKKDEDTNQLVELTSKSRGFQPHKLHEKMPKMKFFGQTSEFSVSKLLQISEAKAHHQGNYICRAGDLEANLSVSISEYFLPAIYETFNMQEPDSDHSEEPELLVIDSGTEVRLTCMANGTNMPNVTWFKEEPESGNFTLIDDNEGRFHISADGGQSLIITYLMEYVDEGIYRCMAKNKRGSAFRRSLNIVKVNSPSIIQTNLLSGSGTMAGQPTDLDQFNLLGRLTSGGAGGEDMEAVQLALRKMDDKAAPMTDFMDDVQLLDENNKVILRCSVEGKPQPSIIWAFLPKIDPKEMSHSRDHQPNRSKSYDSSEDWSSLRLLNNIEQSPLDYSLHDGNQTLEIGMNAKLRRTVDRHAGRYYCLAVNRGGLTAAWLDLSWKLTARSPDEQLMLAAVYAGGLALPGFSLLALVTLLMTACAMSFIAICCSKRDDVTETTYLDPTDTHGLKFRASDDRLRGSAAHSLNCRPASRSSSHPPPSCSHGSHQLLLHHENDHLLPPDDNHQMACQLICDSSLSTTTSATSSSLNFPPNGRMQHQRNYTPDFCQGSPSCTLQNRQRQMPPELLPRPPSCGCQIHPSFQVEPGSCLAFTEGQVALPKLTASFCSLENSPHILSPGVYQDCPIFDVRAYGMGHL